MKFWLYSVLCVALTAVHIVNGDAIRRLLQASAESVEGPEAPSLPEAASVQVTMSPEAVLLQTCVDGCEMQCVGPFVPPQTEQQCLDDCEMGCRRECRTAGRQLCRENCPGTNDAAELACKRACPQQSLAACQAAALEVDF